MKHPTVKEWNDYAWGFKRMEKIQPVFLCHACGWTPLDGQTVKCVNVEVGPWHCPTCAGKLPAIKLEEATNGDNEPGQSKEDAQG